MIFRARSLSKIVAVAASLVLAVSACGSSGSSAGGNGGGKTAKKDIIVTLWRPHWAYTAYPIRDLADPKGAMGGAEQLWSIGRAGFSTQFPEVSAWLKKFRMDDKQLGALEDLMQNKFNGKPAQAVDAWTKENPDFVKGIVGTNTAPTGAGKAITIGSPTGWAEGEAATALWQKILTDKGYKVSVRGLDIGPIFTGLSKGDPDLYLDAWLPNTHSDYWKRFGSKLEKIGIWYDHAKLTIAVLNSSPLKSLDDLKGKGTKYHHEIFGIESGSGLYRISSTKMLPAYGLQNDFKVVPSSTAAMLAQLKKASSGG